jgi:hypothetical protein
MESPNPVQESAKLSIEKIIDSVHRKQGEVIREYLNDAVLRAYFKQRYNREISTVKLEFLKRDLRELTKAHLDLVHYAALIKQMKELNSETLPQGGEAFFLQELEVIFKKYVF